MSRPPRPTTEAAQTYSFSRRAVMVATAQGAVALALAGRMGWLAVAENEHYKLLSESNRVNLTMIPPRRGWIVDRYGHAIANNRTDFRVDIIRDRLPATEQARVLKLLQQLLGLPPEQIVRIENDIKRAAGFQPVQVAENLTADVFAAVQVRLPELPGVAPTAGYSRNYPAAQAVAHLTGYVGAASAEQYQKTKDPLLITPGFKIGKDGLERTLESKLRGEAGAKRVEVTAHGKLVRELETRHDIPGHVQRLTIDAGLQEYAARRLGTNSGAAVVIDCVHGGILAFASMPAYDPNVFSGGITKSEYAMMSADDHLPLFNKALQGLYPPGSCVKPMVSLALLQAGIDPGERVNCTGVYRVGNGLFHCAKHSGHGPVDMHRAIQFSCDVYFYTMGRRLGIDRLAPMARTLGLGQRFDLPFTNQRYGTVPDPEWKLKRFKHAWGQTDTVITSIGQGYMLVNPLQLAVMASRIASGKDLQPRLIANRRYGPQGGGIGLSQEHLDLVHAAMRDVVRAGTAASARLPVAGVEMAGKTGSAQVKRISMADRAAGRTASEGFQWKYRDHGHFIGFAPFDEPRYAIGVTLEHGNHGAAAAQVARDIMTFLYAPDRAMTTLAALEQGWGGNIGDRMDAQVKRWEVAHDSSPTPQQEADTGPDQGTVD